MWSFGRGEREPDTPVAAEDASELDRQAARLVHDSHGESWYTHPGNPVDAALVALCRLRRVESGRKRSSEGGDEAVRRALEQAKPESVVWLASRVVSYMDEHGFPEDVEPWLDRAKPS